MSARLPRAGSAPDPTAALPHWLLRQYRHAPAPLLVLGGTSDERAAVAGAFWQAGPLHAGPLVRVDCARDEAALRAALEDWLTSSCDQPAAAPLRAAERGTLFLDDIGRLGGSVQRLLLTFVKRFLTPVQGAAPEFWAGRLIAGAPESLVRELQDGRFSPALFDALDKLRVDLGRRASQGAA